MSARATASLHLLVIFAARIALVGLLFLGSILITCLAQAQPSHHDIDDPPHRYRERTPQDRFSLLKDDLEAGRISLDRSSEKAFLLGLLKLLEIPASSQMLVFSTTSLQLSLISPANPRALYFNEDVYLGYVPRGRIEVVALDPELGGIFYILDIPRESRPLRLERSERCMNCHAGEEVGYVPGLVVKSVVPGPSGGSLTAYRLAQTGHGIPFEERFGGWHVTGRHGITNHWGNLTGRFANGNLEKIPNPPASRFEWSKFPVATSDILPHLLHEHQAGFVNRTVQASYQARTLLHASGGEPTAKDGAELDEIAQTLTRYLLFADEVPLPEGGVEGDLNFREDFLRGRRTATDGTSLKDFDLQTRLFKHRCSYMIYSPSFTGLPKQLKQRVYGRLGAALSGQDSSYAYLPTPEKQTIQNILKATLPDWPSEG